MKKKRLIIAVVIICCVILYIWQTNKIHNTPKKDTAVSTKSNATTQLQFLKDTPKSKFDIADIDGDGTPEFFTLEVGMDAAMYKYNAKKDKVKKLHSYQLGKASVMYYSKDKHQVVFVTGDTGGGEFDTYEYTDGELKKIESLVWHNGKFEEEGYILDGEKISMEERDNYIENIREEYQSLRGEM